MRNRDQVSSYKGELFTDDNVYADYKFQYGPPRAVDRWEKTVPVSMWGKGERHALKYLDFVGDPKRDPASARGERVDEQQQPR